MPSDLLLEQQKRTLLYFHTESEKVFNLAGEQRNPCQSEMSRSHRSKWLKNKPNHEASPGTAKPFLCFTNNLGMWTKIQLWASTIADNSKKLEITRCPTTGDCLNTRWWMNTTGDWNSSLPCLVGHDKRFMICSRVQNSTVYNPIYPVKLPV